MKIKILLGITLFCVMANLHGQEKRTDINITATDIITVMHDYAYAIAGMYNLGFFFRGLPLTILTGLPLTIVEGMFIKYLCRKIVRHSCKYGSTNNTSQNVTQIITVQ